ncbi:hypothetical protein FNV43_RR07213 [Rhamnella rubrinervis]|uniref:Domain X domain-containing protein n=1 Tax=Rhamnella rubrinervis TaxID=2594499 RepID=A0A8K0HG36_9ROSA|nr:hypothetical protein FNV43_RR07213 [Rhamnella rubrinervis]
MGCLEKAVKDKKILGLINSALKASVRNRSWGEADAELRKKKKKEAAKVPSYGHCGILSPLLANICLNELDYMMEDKIVKFFRPSKLDSIWKDSINDGCHNPSWPEFVPSSGKEKTRKMDYIRYGGHFLIGIRGPRDEAVDIRKQIIEFCETKFGLRLDNSKLEIEHIARGIQFLDHIICRRVIHPTLLHGHRWSNCERKVAIKILSRYLALQCFTQVKLIPPQMNKFLETMADWYRYADNRKKVVGFCAYVIRSSVAKLYAARYRLKSRAKVYKIASRDLSRPLRESSNNAAPEYSDLLRMGLVDAIEGVQFSHMSSIPSCDYTPSEELGTGS